MEAPCLTFFASFRAISDDTMYWVPSCPKPKLSQRKELCVSNYSPSLPTASPKPPLWLSPCHTVLLLGQNSPALPRCNQSRAKVPPPSLGWKLHNPPETSVKKLFLPPWKCWGLGLPHEHLGFNLGGKKKSFAGAAAAWRVLHPWELLEEHRNVSPSSTSPSRSAVLVGRVQPGFSKLQSVPLFGFERQFLMSPSKTVPVVTAEGNSPDLGSWSHLEAGGAEGSPCGTRCALESLNTQQGPPSFPEEDAFPILPQVKPGFCSTFLKAVFASPVTQGGQSGSFWLCQSVQASKEILSILSPQESSCPLYSHCLCTMVLIHKQSQWLTRKCYFTYQTMV